MSSIWSTNLAPTDITNMHSFEPFVRIVEEIYCIANLKPMGATRAVPKVASVLPIRGFFDNLLSPF
jgi:hypothetical protein